ncbi:hypothetical protein [Ferruginibacter albus]|uniref:hypothetical protein n=1 Tax=Ferruginibacter albus TaxID=2875540 RepID=UPI001CC59450|nr:hypothetical protein [Ferruginibacter albus]UAY52368.1 hypothetical protein K9M53_01430 [Ferruginibacter albus]
MKVFLVLYFFGIPLLVGFLIYFKRKKLDADKNYYAPKKQKQNRAITKEEKNIIYVASAFENKELFSSRAKEVAQTIEFDKAIKLKDYFHNNPPVPEDLQQPLSKYGILGVWMEVCQNSIFEILYNYNEKAIPIIYPIAFGVYDWTQYKAIDLLFRFMKEGIKKDEIIAALKKFSEQTSDEYLKDQIKNELSKYISD